MQVSCSYEASLEWRREAEYLWNVWEVVLKDLLEELKKTSLAWLKVFNIFVVCLIAYFCCLFLYENKNNAILYLLDIFKELVMPYFVVNERIEMLDIPTFFFHNLVPT